MILLLPWMDAGSRDRCITSNAAVAAVPSSVVDYFLAIPTQRARAQSILERVSLSPNEGTTDPDSRRPQLVQDDVDVILERGGNCIERTFAIIALAYACGLSARAQTLPQRGAIDHMVAIVTLDDDYIADALEPLPELRPYIPVDAT